MPPQTTEMTTAFLGFLSHPNSRCLCLRYLFYHSYQEPCNHCHSKRAHEQVPHVLGGGVGLGSEDSAVWNSLLRRAAPPACSASIACLAVYKQDHAIAPPQLILGSVKSLWGHQICCDKLFLGECTKVRPGDPVMSFKLGFLTGVWGTG